MSFPPSLPRLIALTGHQRAGKITAAKVMVKNHGYAWTRFASPIREMLRALGLTDYQLDGPGKTEPCPLLMGKTPVHAMQTLGTEWGRNLISPILWCDQWARMADVVLHEGGAVVVDDVRFAEEAAIVREMGGVIWRVQRPGIDRTSDHSSEDGGIVADATLYNVGDLDMLEGIIFTQLGCVR